MPEGDTVHLTAARLHRALAERTLTDGELRVPRFATTDLAGRRVHEVAARGKHILMRCDGDLTLHSHLGMDGAWHLYRAGDRWRLPAFEARAVLRAGDREAVGFRLRAIQLVGTDREGDVVGHLGPDPLGGDWDADRAVANLRAAPGMPIGEALLDQRKLAGLGNVYKSEVCFLKGIDPWMPVGEVRDLEGLVVLCKSLMEANRSGGMQITTGSTRRGQGRWVYGRRDEPCRRCGTAIRQATDNRAAAPRVTYWCPRCQEGDR